MLRLLDKEAARLDLDDARHERATRSTRSIALIREPHGILLVTGPDRLGQDDDALRGAVAAAARHGAT